MKKTIVLFLMLFSVLTFAKDGGFGGETGIGVGIIDVNGKSSAALRLNFNPEFKISKFGIGAKLGLYMGDGIPVDINGDGKENYKDIDFGLRYMEWDGDIIKARYGTLDDFTLGHGTLVYNYSNNEKISLRLGLHDPERRGGVDVFFPLEKDIFGAKVEKEDQPKAMGARVYVRPLKLAGVETPIIKNLEFGATYAADVRDKFNRIIDEKGTFETETVGTEEVATEYSGKVSGMTYEVAMPIIEDVLIPYYDRVTVKGERDLLPDGSTGKESETVTGDHVGVMGKLSILNYKFEYRNIDAGLTPGYFGKFYEVKSNQQLEKVLKAPDEKISGYFGELSANFAGITKLTVSYEDYDKDDMKPHIFGQMNITPSEKFQAHLTYDQINFGADYHKDDFLNDDTVIKAKIVAPASMVGIPGPFIINADIKQTYYYNDKDNKYIPSRTYTMGMAFIW